jgi:predicted nucleic acid-binding Zn ribbon protein
MGNYRSNKPVSLDSVIKNSLKRRHIENKLSQYKDFSKWKDVVGEKLFEVSYPEKILSNKILVVKVLDSVWGQEITFNKQKILDTINKNWSGIHLEDLRIAVSNPVEFKKRFPNK